MSIVRHKINQGAAIRAANSDALGVCLQACRQWVNAKLTNNWELGETVYTFFQEENIGDLISKHQRRNKFADREVNGLDNHVSARRSGGGCFSRFSGLRSRDDVINHVLTVKGVFIYVATERNGGGHAFAFDSQTNNELVFFDPNQGEWKFDDESVNSIKTWWREFWDASGSTPTGKDQTHGTVNYKGAFTKGDRELWQYKVPE